MADEGAVKVCVRVRPLIQREEALQQNESVQLYWKADKNTVSQTDGTKSYSFDRVFCCNETTKQLYQEIASSVVHSAVQGYNGTIFAYGQTSSGKTYTMMGCEECHGIIPLAINDVFGIIKQSVNREFLLRVSYMEIYNETVTDLLCDAIKKKPLEIREDINRTIYVADLTEELCNSETQITKWLKKGEKNRHYAETRMNVRSSRSHTIFRMIIESREKTENASAENPDIDGAVMVSHLNLVDLAGSERASQTGAEGVRLKEGCNINRSLFILGQVIKKLTDGQAGGFVNYRDSKLTRILQNSLGGNAKTIIICTVTPASCDETLSTLQFASTAKYMKNTPHVNEVVDDQALLKRYRKEILELKRRLQDMSNFTQVQASEKEELLRMEMEQLQKEHQDRIRNMYASIISFSADASLQDQRIRRKRRETWAPGKLKHSFRPSSFETNMKLQPEKRLRIVNDLSTVPEMDDSYSTECAEWEEAWVHPFDDAPPEMERSSFVTVQRSRSAFQSTMVEECYEFPSQGSVSDQDFSPSRQKEIELKCAQLEQQIDVLTGEKNYEHEKRLRLEKKIVELEQELLSQTRCAEELRNASEKKDELDQYQCQPCKKQSNQENSMPGNDQVSPSEIQRYAEDEAVQLDSDNLQTQFETSLKEKSFSASVETWCKEKEDFLEKLEAAAKEKRELTEKVIILEKTIESGRKLPGQAESGEYRLNINDREKTGTVEQLTRNTVELHEENNSMFEKVDYTEVEEQSLCLDKSTGLRKSALLDTNREKDFIESIQICEALMAEKESLYAQLDALVLENENLKRELQVVEEQLKEKTELNEFETLEKETWKHEEAQLLHEIANLKSIVENAEAYNKELEEELQVEKNNTVEKEKQITDLSDQMEMQMHRLRNLEEAVVHANNGDLIEQVNLLKKTVADAEMLTLDSKREAAILRSENHELKEKVEQMSSVYQQMKKDLQTCQTQLQAEKSHFKQMQSDCQKELKDAFNENMELRQILNGKIPADFVSHAELEKELLELKKKLQRESEEKWNLEDKLNSLSECKLLPAKVEELTLQLADLNEKLEQKSTAHDVLLSEKCRISETNVHLLNELEGVRNELGTAVARLEATGMVNVQLSHKENQLECIATLTEEGSDLKAALESLRNEKKQYENRIQDADRELADLSSRLEEKCAAYNLLLSEQSHLSEKNVHLLNEVEGLRSDLSKAMNRSEVTELEELQFDEKCHSLEGNISVLKKEKDELQKALEKQGKDENETQNQENKQFADTNEGLEQKCAACNQLLSEHTQLSERNIHLLSELEGLKGELTTVMSKLEATALERVELAQKYQQFEDDITVWTKERNELQQALESLRSEREQYEKLSIENLSDLSEKLDQKCAAYDLLLSEHSHLSESNATLLNELERLKDNQNISLNKLDVANLENVEIGQNHHQLENALMTMKREREELQQTLESLRNEKNQSERLAQEKDTVLAALSERLEQKSAAYDVVLDEQSHLSERNVHLLNEVETLKDDLSSVMSRLDSADLTKATLVKKHQQLEEDLAALRKEKSELHVTLESLKCKKEEEEKRMLENCIQFTELSERLEQKCVAYDNLLCKESQLHEKNLHLANEVDRLKDDLSIALSRFEEANLEKNERSKQCQQLEGDIAALTKERAELQQALESLSEKDKGKEQIQEKDMLILQLNDKMKIVTFDHDRQVLEENESAQITESDCPQLQLLITSLTQRRDELQQTVELISAERDQLKMDLQENIETSIEVQDELRCTQDKLKKKVQLVNELKNKVLEQASEIVRIQEKGCESRGSENLQEKILQLQEELNVVNLQCSKLQSERAEVDDTLHHVQHLVITLTQEKDNLQQILESISAERDQLKLDMEEKSEMMLQLSENLKVLTVERDRLLSEKAENSNAVQQNQNLVSSLSQEKNEMQVAIDRISSERDCLKMDILEKSDLMLQLSEDLKVLTAERDRLLSEKAENSNAVQQNQHLLSSLSQEKNEMQEALDRISSERDHLKAELLEKTVMMLQLSENLQVLTVECDRLLSEKAENSNTLQWNQNLLSSLSQEKNEMQEAINSIISERDRLKVDMLEKSDLMLQLRENLKVFTVERDRLLLERAENSNALQQNQHLLSSLSREKDEMQAALDRISSEKDHLKTDMLEKTEMMLQLNEDLKALTVERDSLLSERAENSNNVQQNQHLISSFTQEKNGLQAALDSISSERDRLKADMVEKSEMMLQLREDLKVVTGERDRLRSENQENENAAHHLQHLIASVTLEKNELQLSLENIRAEMEQQKTDLLEKSETQISLRVSEYDQLLRENELLNNRHKELLKEVDHLKEELKTTACKLEAVELEKLETICELKHLQEAANVAAQERDELQQLKTELQDLKFNNTKLMEEYRVASQGCKSLTSETEQLKSTLHCRQTSILELEVKNESLSVKLREYEDQTASVMEEKEKLEFLLETLKVDRNNLLSSLEEQKKAVEVTDSEVKLLQTSLMLAEQKIEEMESLISEKKAEELELSNELASYAHKLTLLNQDLCSEQKKNLEISEQLTLLENEVSFLKAEQDMVHREDPLAVITEQAALVEEKSQQMQELFRKYQDQEIHTGDNFTSMETILQIELEAQKEHIEDIKTHLTSSENSCLDVLQMENQKQTAQLQILLQKLKNACIAVPQRGLKTHKAFKEYDEELTAEKKTQEELLIQIRCIEQYASQWAEAAAPELRKCELKMLTEMLEKKVQHMPSIVQLLSDSERTVLDCADFVRQELQARKNINVLLSATDSGSSPVLDKAAAALQQDNARLAVVTHSYKEKLMATVKFIHSVTGKHATHFRQCEKQLKKERSENKELLQKLQNLKETLAPSSSAIKLLEDEHQRTVNKLKATEQDLKGMQKKLQDLESKLCSAHESTVQHETRIRSEQMKCKTAESKLREVKSNLVEKEMLIESVQKEMKALEAKVVEGAGPYEEEITNLKNQLVKADLERMKMTKIFEQENASLKANLEYKETITRRLKEELRKAQECQDSSVLFENPRTPVSVPITCGGGSGIVQSTALLVLKSENAKLQEEVKRLSMDKERLASLAHQFKADSSKWKERACKLRESISTRTLPSSYTSHDRVPLSPRRDQETVTPKEPVSFSQNEHCSEETRTFDSPKSKIFDSNSESLPRTGVTKFFDNTALGNIPDLSPENEGKRGDIGQWFEKGKTNNECKTQ